MFAPSGQGLSLSNPSSLPAAPQALVTVPTPLVSNALNRGEIAQPVLGRVKSKGEKKEN